MNSDFYKWGYDEDKLFRRLIFTYQTDFMKEIDKFKHWYGEFKTCLSCGKDLPLSGYFFHSAGNGKYHSRCKKCNSNSNYKWGNNDQKIFNEKGFYYCSKCDRALPLNEFYFAKGSTRTGFSCTCKECKGSEFGLISFNSYKDLLNIRDGYKLCNTCLIEYPDKPEYFFKNEAKKNGSVRCKKCEGHDFGVKKPNLIYRDDLLEGYKFCVDCGKLVKDELFNKQLSRCSQCFKKKNNYYYNLPQYKTKRKKYQKTPKFKHRMRMEGQKRRAAKNKINNIDLFLKEYKNTLHIFNNSCAYCGMSNTEHMDVFCEILHQDHIIPLSKGGSYVVYNIIPACRSCNCSKKDKDLMDYYEYTNNFAQEEYLKILRFIIQMSNFKDMKHAEQYLLDNRLLKLNTEEYYLIFPKFKTRDFLFNLNV